MNEFIFWSVQRFFAVRFAHSTPAKLAARKRWTTALFLIAFAAFTATNAALSGSLSGIERERPRSCSPSNFCFTVLYSEITKTPPLARRGFYWRRRPDSDRRIKVLQTFALPLGYGAMREKSLKKWSGRRGSDSRPQPWQGCALPTELLPHKMVPRTGVEPVTRKFSVCCSTN